MTATAKVKAAATDPATVAWSIAWLSLPVTFGILEGRAMITDEPQDTLTYNIRRLFHTNTRTGRTAWVIAWGFISAMVAAHITSSSETWWE